MVKVLVKKEKGKGLATGWLNSKGEFEEVSRIEQETWASRHLISDLKDLTHDGYAIEEQLQIFYNYMKFEDGVLMSVVWRKPNMFWTKEQETWMEKNWELIDPYSHKFIKETSLLRTLQKIQE